MKRFFNGFRNSLLIALKDINDAIRSRIVVSMLFGGILLLGLPKILPLLFVQPDLQLVLFDPGESHLAESLHQNDNLSIRDVDSLDDLILVISDESSLTPLLGVAIPEKFDTSTSHIQVFTNWANRYKFEHLKTTLLAHIQDPQPSLDEHILYTNNETALSGIMTIGAIILVLSIGITLVPHLILEEKQEKTLQVLLVSPAKIQQIVFGKALGGVFYVSVMGILLALFTWNRVIHWDIMVLFILFSALFSVGIGLLFGVLFNSAQEFTAWISIVIVVLVAAMMINYIPYTQIPSFIKPVLPWVPSNILQRVYMMSMTKAVNLHNLWDNLSRVFLISLPVYGTVIWKIRQMDK